MTESKSSKKEELPLAGMRVAVFLEEDYQDVEMTYPLYRLREDGVEAFTCGVKKGAIYKGRHGYPYECEVALSDVKSSDIDGIIIPGGYSPDKMRRTPRFAELVKECHAQGKVVAAICHGPWLLVSAKVLKGKRATSYFSIRDDIENAGAIYVENEETVVDGNLITARVPGDCPAFMRATIKFLRDYKAAKDKKGT